MRKAIGAVACWVALGLGSCGPEGDAGDGGRAKDRAEDDPGAQLQAGPGTLVIRMSDDMEFSPEHAVVDAGDTIVWVQDGALPHTTSNGPGTAAVLEHAILPPGAEPWDSGLLDPGRRFTLVLTTPGEYTYLCMIHEAAGMIGRITVR